MNRTGWAWLALALGLGLAQSGCEPKSNPAAEAPPPLKLERVEDRNLFTVEHPERFALTEAVAHVAAPELKVTGVGHSRHFPERAGDFAGHRAASWRSTRAWATP